MVRGTQVLCGSKWCMICSSLDEDWESRPGILHSDCMKCVGLTEMK